MSGTATLPRTQGNLPAEMTRFVGRRRDLGQAGTALRSSRLVTLCGPAGVGKTRLALKAAAEAAGDFGGGVWLVELSALRDSSYLAATVASTLRLPDQSADDPLETLTAQLSGRLADRELLLILDTCEHLVDACALLAEVLLRAVPGLRILATSREPLDVIGETVLAVAPLDLPADGAADPRSDAVVLFTERARGAVPGYSPTGAELECVARLCRRLEGIPLALELAAVRLRTMTAQQVLDRLDDRFRLLGGSRGGGGRRQTLRGAIEWSHGLCSPQERRLWARLSVFPGGFDLEAAERVCAEPGEPDHALLDTLGRLVEKSVVVFDQGGRRYRLLDTLREYGAERLRDAGEHGALGRAHRDHFLRLAEQAYASEITANQTYWILRLAEECDNIRAALAYSFTTPGEGAGGLALAVGVRMLVLTRGMFHEGHDWFTRAAAAAPEPTPLRARALLCGALSACGLGLLDEADALCGQAAETAAGLGDTALTAEVRETAAFAAVCRGDDERALTEFHEAIAVFREDGFRDVFQLASLCGLAGFHALRVEAGPALALCEEGLRRSGETGERWCRTFLLVDRGLARYLTGDAAGALRDAATALEAARDIGDMLGLAVALDLTALCLAGGDPMTAATLAAVTERMWRFMRSPMLGPHYVRLREGAMAMVTGPLAADELEAACTRGSTLDPVQAADLALGNAALRGTAGSGAVPGGTVPGPRGEPDSGGRLTPRETEIAGLVADGLSNRQIADRLAIAKRTVDAHVDHIFTKLGFTSRAQLAAWTHRSG